MSDPFYRRRTFQTVEFHVGRSRLQLADKIMAVAAHRNASSRVPDHWEVIFFCNIVVDSCARISKCSFQSGAKTETGNFWDRNIGEERLVTTINRLGTTINRLLATMTTKGRCSTTINPRCDLGANVQMMQMRTKGVAKVRWHLRSAIGGSFATLAVLVRAFWKFLRLFLPLKRRSNCRRHRVLLEPDLLAKLGDVA